MLAALAAACVAGCKGPEPRSYEYFLEDKIARDGVLARCDADPAAARTDIECANALRAALTIQLQEERARREALERESAERIEALRRQYEAERQAREAAAAAAAQAAERALYPEEFFETVPLDGENVGDAEPSDDGQPVGADGDLTDDGHLVERAVDASDTERASPF
ncbi:MAG: EexN family lipoprotein [Gammaproteobacteria bacterium]|nr:hypothetical protein [Gammaproteobacteria bacterium]